MAGNPGRPGDPGNPAQNPMDVPLPPNRPDPLLGHSIPTGGVPDAEVFPSGGNGGTADEVTLAFAVGPDPEGRIAPLPETVVLATILAAVETERSRPGALLLGPGEAIESVAPVYWPLLVLPAPAPGHVAIFDGTGVWRRSFLSTSLLALDRFRALPSEEPTPSEVLLRFKELVGLIGRSGADQTMTVEGFLPVDPPLMFEVLSQASLNTPPQTPHAAFLPARHPVEWFESAVAEMGRALQQFEGEITELGQVRATVRETLDAALVRLEGERRDLERHWATRSAAAQEEMARELDELHQAVRQQIRIELDQIRRSNAVISHSMTSVSVAHTLGRRGERRGRVTTEHDARASAASAAEHEARRQIKDSQRRLVGVHERERQQMMVLADRMARIEQQAAEAYAANELFRDELDAAGADLLGAVGAQINDRTARRNVFASYFLPLPALEGMRVLWFPVWVATLRSARGVRFLVFPPMQARSPTDASAFRGFFGGIHLPLERRSARLDVAVQETIQAALASDAWFHSTMRELVQAADVTTDSDFLLRLGQGLEQIRLSGWITEKQERRIREAFEGHVRARHGPGAFPSVTSVASGGPSGATQSARTSASAAAPDSVGGPPRAD